MSGKGWHKYKVTAYPGQGIEHRAGFISTFPDRDLRFEVWMKGRSYRTKEKADL